VLGSLEVPELGEVVDGELMLPAPEGFAWSGVVSGIIPGWLAVPELGELVVDGEPMLDGVVSVPVAPEGLV